MTGNWNLLDLQASLKWKMERKKDCRIAWMHHLIFISYRVFRSSWFHTYVLSIGTTSCSVFLCIIMYCMVPSARKRMDSLDIHGQWNACVLLSVHGSWSKKSAIEHNNARIACVAMEQFQMSNKWLVTAVVGLLCSRCRNDDVQWGCCEEVMSMREKQRETYEIHICQEEKDLSAGSHHVWKVIV